MNFICSFKLVQLHVFSFRIYKLYTILSIDCVCERMTNGIVFSYRKERKNAARYILTTGIRFGINVCIIK